MPETWLVLAKPKIEVSTAWAYQNYNNENINARPGIDAMKEAIASQDRAGIFACMGNVLESVTCKAYPEILAIKYAMDEAGADISLMSGSGPTVFCFVQSRERGESVVSALRKKFDVDIELTKTLRRNGL